MEAGKLADIDPTPFIAKLTSLSCWSFSSTNWSSYALVRDDEFGICVLMKNVDGKTR
ncbi:hypothetical protein RhiirB3_459521 [Rhizophagus irregularis]|nr:hypothetical protein RhiirB3_459521 [Rhizophagus irregularis]